MRILCLGDIHYRATTPRCRVDDFPQALFGKMEQAYNIAHEQKCQYIIAPGDVFDSPTPPMWLLRQVVEMHKHRGIKFLVVLGQHDQRYHHHARENTPLGVLEAAGMVQVLGPEPTLINKAEFYGSSWSDDIPKPPDTECPKILVMHRMIIGSEKLWAAQEEYMWAKHVLRRNKFDLIVTGDNHQFFTEIVPGRNGHRHLINCGSLMRSTIGQTKHKPTVAVYDTTTKKLDIIPLKVEKASGVFSIEEAEREKEHNAELESFVEQVKNTTTNPDLNFLKNLNKLVEDNCLTDEVKNTIAEIIELSN